MPTLKFRQSPAIENLPPKYKWEVLRRHPHYIRDWKVANLDAMTPADHPMRSEPDWGHIEAAVARLHALTGYHEWHYPDPAKTAEEMPDLPSRGPCATTLSVRDVLEGAIYNLPPEVQQAVGRILLGEGLPTGHSVARYVADDGRSLNQENLKILGLTRLRHPALEKPLPANLLVNLYAPLRGIVKEVTCIVKEEKSRRGFRETRPHPEKLDQYLGVWDRREGWQGGRYDGRQEKPLRLVAAEVGRLPNTVRAQYQAAFALIFGMEYTPEDWWRLMARHKWPGSKYQGWRTPKSSAQPATVSGVPIEAVTKDDGAADLRDLVAKLRELGRQGIAPREIARRLEIREVFGVVEEEAEEIVEQLLAREDVEP